MSKLPTHLPFDVASALVDSLSRFGKENIRGVRAAFARAARQPECAIQALEYLRENDMPTTLRMDFAEIVGKNNPGQILPMLESDPAVARMATLNQVFHTLPGAVEALAEILRTRTDDYRDTDVCELVKLAIGKVLEPGLDAPLHMLEVLAGALDLGSVRIKGLHMDNATALHYLVGQIKLKTNSDYATMERAVEILLQNGLDLETTREARGMFMGPGKKTALQYACHLRDDMERVETDSPTLDNLINALLAAGAQWTGCDEGDGYSATLVRAHPAWRKQALQDLAGTGSPDNLATRKHKL